MSAIVNEINFFDVPIVTDINEAKQIVEKKVTRCFFKPMIFQTKRNFKTEYLIFKREPFVLRGFDLGECVNKWSVAYLSRVVKDKQVKIHVSAVSEMDFLKKNFIYRLNLKFASLDSNHVSMLIELFFFEITKFKNTPIR
jgi:hypothetical protein